MLKREELESIRSMSCFCALEIGVEINGVYLDENDFGSHYDTDRENAEPYGCGNMQFIPYETVDKKVLEKYNINEEEYRMIQDKLDCLSFGCCGWCV